MNFLAIPTLKNDRACFRFPISIKPLRSLKFTFESERTGIAMVGSLRRAAASITRSATLTSFFSTAVGFLAFLAMPYFFLRLAARVAGAGLAGLRLAFVACLRGGVFPLARVFLVGGVAVSGSSGTASWGADAPFIGTAGTSPP